MKSKKSIQNLIEFGEQTILEMSDDEILNKAKNDRGDSWKDEIAKTRNMLLKACDDVIANESKEQEDAIPKLPLPSIKELLKSSLQEKQRFLVELMQFKPELELTLQFREFTDLDEEELNGILEDLDDLGAFDNEGQK